MTAAGDPRFYERSGPHSLATLASVAEAELRLPASAGIPPADAVLAGIAPLQVAGPNDVSFLDNARYLRALRATRAGAVIVHPDMAGAVPEGTAALLTPMPYAGWARVCALFHPGPSAVPGVHPSAVVAASAMVDPSAEIGPLAVVGARAEIAAGCQIGAGTTIGDGVAIGADCRIGAQSSISHAILGRRVVIHPGVRIGQDGFGFATTPRGFLSVPQLGRVLVEDDVDIGANTTIDRGSAADTVIGAGTRIDNLVQIAHNVRVGRMCVIVAQVGISGSTVLDDFVMVGGQVGIVGHAHIGAKARIGAQAGVMSDVAAGADVVGSPALPAKEFWRMTALLRRLARRRGDTQSDE